MHENSDALLLMEVVGHPLPYHFMNYTGYRDRWGPGIDRQIMAFLSER